MCLIIHKQANQVLEPAFINDVWAGNKDGWGVFYYAGGKLQVDKGLTLEGFYKALKDFDNREAMIHFRYATHGEKTLEMAHPFHIIDDIWMMHNGMLSGKDYQCPNGKKSDTALFAELVKEILAMSENPNEFIRSDKFKSLVMPEIGSNSIVFADDQGFILMDHALSHKTTCGLAVSNSYAYSYNNPDDMYKSYRGSYSQDWTSYKDNYTSSMWWELDDFLNEIDFLSYEEIVETAKDNPYMIADALIELSLRKRSKRQAA